MTEVYDKIKGRAVVQSDAEPVAWLYRYPADGVEEWSFTLDKEHANEREIEAGCIVEPLYTAPPRPDAQSDAEPDEDRPLGFRTNDVPDPYAEGPQSDMEPGGPADYIPIGGAGNGA
jgi:hypothetical protein